MRRVPRIRTDDVSPVSVLKRSASGVGGHTLRWPHDWTGEAASTLQRGTHGTSVAILSFVSTAYKLLFFSVAFFPQNTLVPILKKSNQHKDNLQPLFMCRSFIVGPSASDLVRAIARLIAASGLLILCYRMPPGDAGIYAETIGRIIAAVR
jgi:hypothetical protein